MLILATILSKEKFVRGKPHLNIGLIAGVFVVGLALAAGLTYLYPDVILLGYYLLSPRTSSLRDTLLHTTQVLMNGTIHGAALVIAVSIVMKGKNILQN